jgi:Uma2 family endonuclease
MATSTQASLGEYMSASYRPDREYIDGELWERNAGKREHARLQALLTGWFMNHESDWQIMVLTECRVKVAATRVRIPDVTLVRPGPQPDVLTEPPLLVVEILSPDDSYSDTQERAADYLRMGVETIWIIDPRTRSARVCGGANWQSASRLDVPRSPIFIEIGELFAHLDKPVA